MNVWNFDNCDSLQEFLTQVKERVRKEQDELVEKQVDEVKLEEKGWKDRYYSVKLHNAVTPQELAREYFIGLAWVLK